MIKAKDIERDEPIDLMVIAADVVSEMALKELELIPLLKNNFYDIIQAANQLYIDENLNEPLKAYLIKDLQKIIRSSVEAIYRLEGMGGNETYSKEKADRRKVSGTIKTIVKDSKAYASFIRDKRKSDRISKNYKARRHELLTNPTRKNQEELESYSTISLSQRLLLLIEAERLSKFGKDRNAVNRMTVVKKLLKESKVAKPLDDGTIGVGTKFELRYNKDGKIETLTGEMINQAVSDEVDTDYVERISPLGQQIYGLRVGDPFTFRDGNKVYKGSVAAVELAQQPQQETIGYQYHK